jgi:hydrogenase small subunit
MPFMDEPPGAKVSSKASGAYGAVVRKLRAITAHSVDEEPKWRRSGRTLTTGYRPPW